MRLVVAPFVKEVEFLGRCSVRVVCCVLLLFVVTECSRGIVKEFSGKNEAVAIE